MILTYKEFLNESTNPLTTEELNFAELDKYLKQLFNNNFTLQDWAKINDQHIYFKIYTPDGKKNAQVKNYIKKMYSKYNLDIDVDKKSGWTMGISKNWDGTTGLSYNNAAYIITVYIKK